MNFVSAEDAKNDNIISQSVNSNMSLDGQKDLVIDESNISINYVSSLNNIRHSGKTILITQNSYDTYFNKFNGEIRSDADILPGDILKIGNITNRAFVIDRQLTLTHISANDQISNGVIHLIAGSDGSTVTGLKIINTVGALSVDGIYVMQLHGIWFTKSNNNTISYNIIRIANAAGVYGMPMGYSSYNRIVYNDIKTYITCTMVMGSCHNNIISHNSMETLSYSEVSVTNLIYYNPYGHADYGGPATCYNNLISENYLKSYCTGAMSIVLQLLGGSHNTVITNNTIVLGSYGIGIVAENVTIKNNIIKDSATSILAEGKNLSVVNNNIYGSNIRKGISVSGTLDSVATVANNTVTVTNVYNGIVGLGYTNIENNIINIANYGVGINLENNSNNANNNKIHVLQDSGITFLGSYNVIDNNIIDTKSTGISISYDYVARYYNNTISNNIIRSDSYGIFIKGYVYYSTISNNVIETNATIGIYKEITDEIADDDSDNMINGVIYDATALIVNDDNFYNYFDENGYLNYTFKSNKTHVIFFTFLTNKDVYFTEKINLISNKMSNLLFDVTIHLIEDADGSLIRDFNFYNNNKVAIVLNCVNDVNVNNNNFTMVFKNDSVGSSAILVENVCNDCVIKNNNIYINSKAKYAYGISISAYNSVTNSYNKELSKRFTISNNNIIMISKGVAEAIYSDVIVDSNILNNNINIISDSFGYGIATGNVIGRQYGLNISDNEIIIHSKKMAYLIELHMNDNVSVSNNYLYGEGNGVYGIATYKSDNISLLNNEISVFGGDLSKIGLNFDVLGSGNGAIFISKFSNNTNITQNIIYTNVTTPILIGNSSFIVNITNNSYVIDNYNYIVYFNNESNIIFNDIIRSGDTILFNNLTNDQLMIVDIPVNITAYKHFHNFTASLILTGSACNLNISRLTFINSNLTLNNVYNITVLNNSFLNNISININKGNNNSLINNSFNLKGVNGNVIILNNTKLATLENNIINLSYCDVVKAIMILNSEDVKIAMNNISGIGESVTLISSFNSKYSSIMNNILTINGSSAFGYYGVNSHFDSISNNEIYIHGKGQVTNQSGVYYSGSSSSNKITDNTILSYSLNGDDYAVIILSDENLFNSVTYNYLISSNGSKRADYAVYAIHDLVFNNTPCYIYVSAINGSDTLGDGSLNNPFSTISHALKNALNICTIYLLKGNYTESNLTIAGNLTLTATNLNGDVYINCNGKQLFNITSTGSLVINALKIYNAFTVVGGGVFINNGTLLVNNSIIYNCSSYYDNSHPNFTGKYPNNENPYYSFNCSEMGMGGVILNYGNLLINSSAFYNNFAHKGGVLADFGKTTISSSVFYNNTGVHGGVIFTNTVNTLSIVNASVFLNNTAITCLDFCRIERRCSGWSIYEGYRYEYSSVCEVYKNSSAHYIYAGVGHGGVIYSNSPILIRDSIFGYNSANSGGVIAQVSSYGEYSSYKPQASLEIYNSVFNCNTAKNTKQGNLTHTNSYIYNNYHNGGVIYGTLAKVFISNSTFDYNQAFGSGGALHIQSKDGAIDGSRFANNRAASSGGALCLQGTILITNTEIINNSAYYGGAINYNSYTYYGHVQENLNIFNSTISDNMALDKGGAFFLGASNVSISKSNIMSNFAPSGSTFYSSSSYNTFVDARNNWWGSTRGPDDSVWNLPNIKFRTWLKKVVNWKPTIINPPTGDNGTGGNNPPDNPAIIIINPTNTGPSIGTNHQIGLNPGIGSGSGGSGTGDSGSGGSGNPSSVNGTGGSANPNSGNGANDTINNNIIGGTINMDSLSRSNSSNFDANLVTVGNIPNAASTASEGESGRGDSSSSSSSSANAYEVNKRTTDKITDSNSIVATILVVLIVIMLLILGYKRKQDDE